MHPRKLPMTRVLSNASSEGSSPESGKITVTLSADMVSSGQDANYLDPGAAPVVLYKKLQLTAKSGDTLVHWILSQTQGLTSANWQCNIGSFWYQRRFRAVSSGRSVAAFRGIIATGGREDGWQCRLGRKVINMMFFWRTAIIPAHASMHVFMLIICGYCSSENTNTYHRGARRLINNRIIDYHPSTRGANIPCSSTNILAFYLRFKSETWLPSISEISAESTFKLQDRHQQMGGLRRLFARWVSRPQLPESFDPLFLMEAKMIISFIVKSALKLLYVKYIVCTMNNLCERKRPNPELTCLFGSSKSIKLVNQHRVNYDGLVKRYDWLVREPRNSGMPVKALAARS